MKKWIDNAPYEALLSHWRYAHESDPYLQGDIGIYYKEALKKKRLTANNSYGRMPRVANGQ
jgi:hypothetical protein